MAEEKRDYYEVLEVERDADGRTIKKAFLKKAREIHPDVSDDPDAEEKFKELNEAYMVLSDEEKRANYDRFGFDGPQGFSGYGGFSDFGDFFGGGLDDLLGSFFGGGVQAQSQRRASTRGANRAVYLDITLEEAARGARKKVSYVHSVACESCGGKGTQDEEPQYTTCPTCDGRGRTFEMHQSIMGTIRTEVTCPNCKGMGEILSNPCKECDGEGRVEKNETIEIDVPAGISSGQRMVFTGMGDAGIRGDKAGDVIVTIDVLPDDRFQRQGDDLYCLLDISSLEAMCGVTRHMKDIMGDDIAIEVKPGTQYEDRIVVKGAGMPHLKSELRGNLICIVRIITVSDFTDEELEQLKAMRDARAEKSEPSEDAEVEAEPKKKKKAKRPRKRARK